MTDQEIREKAIADVAEYSGFHIKLVTQDTTQASSSGCIGRAVKYAVLQRETVIRREQLLRKVLIGQYGGGGAFDKTCIECGRRFEYDDQNHYENCIIGDIEAELEGEEK